MCRDASGDSPVRPGVSRRLTLRGVLAAAGDGVPTRDPFAVALRRVGIAAPRGGKLAVTLGMGENLGGEMLDV